ncbi:MAG: hypothetical protein JKY65_26705 [Planctomycetes bacterium]|nr:hypothetical protein [Planctomycetota bacterium]
MHKSQFLLGLALTLLGTSVTLAQDTFSYDLEGRYGWFGPQFDSTLTFTKRADGRYDAVRSWAYQEDGSAPRMTGVADVKVRRVTKDRRTTTVVVIKAVFTPVVGASAVLANLGAVEAGESMTGNYKVEGTRITGWVQVTGRNGETKSVFESGRRTDHPIDHGDYDPAAAAAADGVGADGVGADGVGADGVAPVASDGVAAVESDDPIEGNSLRGTLDANLRILKPGPGVYLAGQQIRLEVMGASVKNVKVVSGNAKVSGRNVILTGPGEIRLQLKKGDRISQPVDLEAIEAEIVGITILDTIAIADAKPPHFSREHRAEAEVYEWEPAAILQDTQLRLKVTFKANKDLTAPAKIRITGSEADFEIQEDVVLQSLANGQVVELISTASLTESVQVNTLDLEWKLGSGKTTVDINETPLRVYTLHGKPVDNPLPRYGPTMRQGLPLNTKLHFELACGWAMGATQNIGNGKDSIGYNVDNQMRHHVAWKDYKGNVPVIPHYPKGAPLPLNYSSLRGYIESGVRPVSSIYYPSQGATGVGAKINYQNNWGWYVLDNPKYVGGRCNQQASLIVDLVGTLGIEAEVYYIERVSRGRLSGRAVRRFYIPDDGGKSWNFHGNCKAKLADGTFWLYDGSGSSPPRRINGRVEDLMAAPGPYIKVWETWRYDEPGGKFAPMRDWPETWRGVPLQKDEPALDPNAADGTYAWKVGRGRMDDKGSDPKFHGKSLTFYVVNVGGEFLFKVSEGKPEAETYRSALHGGFETYN